MERLESCIVPLTKSPIIGCRIFSKKLQGPQQSEESNPANAWLAALQQNKATRGMSREATRGLLTAVHKGIVGQEGKEQNLLAGEQVSRVDTDEAVRLLVSLAHAPEALFGYKSTRW